MLKTLCFGLVITTLCLVTVSVVFHRRPQSQLSSPMPPPAPGARLPQLWSVDSDTATAPPSSNQPEPKQPAPAATRVTQTAPQSAGGLQDPIARAALALVGEDAEAEAYWYAAINDPGLSAKERQDLIEDLNEDGLSDPKHPTLDDLPLIINRLFLIEELAPDAMDQVNADAFAEAYKDLANLANVATGGGEPVR